MTGIERPSTTTTPSLEFPPQRFHLNQTVTYAYSGPVTDLRQRLIVVPRDAHGRQRLTGWHLGVSGAPAVTVSRHDRFGNLVLDVAVPVVTGSVTFTVEADVVVLPAGPASGPGRWAGLRTPSRLTRPDDAVADLARAAGPDPGELCRAVFEAFRYEWGVTSVGTTAAEALAGGVGVCQDYAHVMLAACRWHGLPARYVSGHLLGEGGSHAWVEVLHNRSVEAWDPTHQRRAVDRYVTVAVGRDYYDVAPMSGTFRGLGVTGTLNVTKSLRAGDERTPAAASGY